jgi:hypothetical protein
VGELVACSVRRYQKSDRGILMIFKAVEKAHEVPGHYG